MKKFIKKFKFWTNVIVFLVFVAFPLVFFNRHRLPESVRAFILPSKFSVGQCLVAQQYWGVNPKRVVGYKEKNKYKGYLLQDIDRYEHLQFVNQAQVDKFARQVSCPRT